MCTILFYKQLKFKSGTGTKPKRTGTFKILRTETGTETISLINKVPESNRYFQIKKVVSGCHSAVQ